MPKRLKKKSSHWPIIILVVLVVLGLIKFGKREPVIPKIQENLSQLTSVDKYVGNAVASNSFSDNKYRLSITAFLSTPPDGQVYKARLTSDTIDPKTVELGELNSAGDVYTLNYESTTDYSGYKTLEIVTLTTKTNNEQVLLKGTF